MADGKSPRIAAIVLLVLALGLAWRFVPKMESTTEDKRSSESHDASAKAKQDLEELMADASLPAGKPTPSDSTPSANAAPPSKITERKESLSIRDLEKYGITVEAEHVGKNSATGKVRISTKEGAVLEADQAKMSPNGMLVAEGNPAMVHGEQRMKMGGETAAMAIYFDEEKQSVIVRAASADKVTRPFTDDGVTDPDRSGVR